ncbi:MAG TPA: peptide ABC transporter substrate-binding protein [Candidatus Acidoferrales bacterium]|nr:peptide ABC transporter substrate-binding protein [Candidatus Acidoferrales bacterium]
MTIRDRWLVPALAVLFVAVSTLALAPSFGPGDALSSAAPTFVTARRYSEGVVGHATNASPFGARSAADRELVALLFRGLVRLGPDRTIVGDLASSWEVDPSGGSWTFHLRPGMRWQDGQPITSDDVVFTISTLADPGYTGPGAESWREVTAISVDSLTVTLRLATPLGGFLQAATQPIAPAHLLADVPPADLPASAFGMHPVGSGPFRLVTLDERRAVLDAARPVVAAASSAPGASPSGASPTSSAGPDDAFPLPYLAGIEFDYFDDGAALETAWNRGALDAASGLTPAEAATLGATPGARLLRYPSSTLLAVDLNLRAGHTTFTDPAVRRALLEALDRNAILGDPLLGFGAAAEGLIPAWAPEFDPTANPAVPFDATAAQAALVKAGWKKTSGGWIPKGATAPLNLTLLSADAATNAVAFETADAVANAWRAIGLTVTHVSLPAGELLADRLRPGDYEAAVVPLLIGLDPDVYPLLASSQTRTGGANLSGVQDVALDTLLSAARAPGTPEGRLAAYKALETRLSSSLYILPLAFRDEVVVLRGTVQGPAPRPVGGPGDRFWDVLTWRLAAAPTSS